MFNTERRVFSQDIISIKIFSGYRDIAAPDVVVVPHDSLTHCTSAIIVTDLISCPDRNRVLVVGVMLGVDEVDLEFVAFSTIDNDLVLLLNILRIDGKNLDFFVSLMMTSSVSLLKLH